MKTWFAFELTKEDAYDLQAYTDPIEAWESLRLALAEAMEVSDERVIRLSVGQVEAPDLETALNKIRAEAWLKVAVLDVNAWDETDESL